MRDFLPSDFLIHWLADHVCDEHELDLICSNIVFLIAGYDKTQLNMVSLRKLYKIYLRKERLESILRGEYVLNLLNEPQHLATLKTPKLLQIENKGVTNLGELKLKIN